MNMRIVTPVANTCLLTLVSILGAAFTANVFAATIHGPSGSSFTVPSHTIGSGRPSGGGSAGPSGGGSSGPAYVAPPSGPTPQQQQQQREMAMHDVNDMAVEAYNRGDWAAAIRHLRSALDLQPGDPTLLANLRAVEGRAEAERVQRQAAEQRARAQAQAALQAAEAKKIPIGRCPPGAGVHQDCGETAARESQRVFDRPVALPAVTSTAVVDARTPALRVQIPPALANHAFILRMQAEKAALAKEVQGLEQKLQAIREQRARGEGNRGQLEVQEVATRQEITNATHQIGFVEHKMETFVINMTRASESASAPAPR